VHKTIFATNRQAPVDDLHIRIIIVLSRELPGE